MDGSGGVAIVVPTLNEAAGLERVLLRASTLRPAPAELVLVDGGSTDETVAIASRLLPRLLPVTRTQVLVSDRPGRAVQLNCGVAASRSPYLCFLHADTLPPDDLVAIVRRVLGDSATACGGFVPVMSGDRVRWGASLNNWLKTYYAPLLFRPHLFARGLRLLFGDQVMFCRRADFLACGWFDPALPILEDADLCLRLVRRGRIRLVDRFVESSDRRVARQGNLRATAIYALVGFGWAAGIPAQALHRFYTDIR